MQELCPQLTSLALTLRPLGWCNRITPGVSQLFCSGLQQLSVAYERCSNPGLVLCGSSLVHLSALQQLTLDGVVLEQQGAEQVAQQLGPLQQLRMFHAGSTDIVDEVAALLHLAPSLVDYDVFVDGQDVSVLASCQHLTRLLLNWEEELSQGTAEALAALTGLRELGLSGRMGHNALMIMQQAAGMAQLRSLQLDGFSEKGSELCTCLAQCTQLTSLVMLAFDGGSCGPWVSAVQQLTGLRCLMVREQLLAWEQGRWLAPLTALTRLYAQLHEIHGAPYWGEDKQLQQQSQQHRMQVYQSRAQQLLAGVQQWPGKLRTVIVQPRDHYVSRCLKPMAWQLTPVAQGSVQVTAWLEGQNSCAAGWARPLRPCPHLPGVWELQGRAEGRPWHLV
jgi:hypothetical protein